MYLLGSFFFDTHSKQKYTQMMTFKSHESRELTFFYVACANVESAEICVNVLAGGGGSVFVLIESDVPQIQYCCNKILIRVRCSPILFTIININYLIKKSY